MGNENFAKVLQSKYHLVELADFFLAFHVGFKVCKYLETEKQNKTTKQTQQASDF